MNKYRNKIKELVIDGELIKFHSIAESNRAMQLFLQQKAGEISGLEYQPKYILQEGFRLRGKKHQAITYSADFRYIREGELIVEDVKSKATELDKSYRKTRKLFLNRYGEELFFHEVFMKGNRADVVKY